MRILVIHQGFPGQFKHLIPALQLRGDQVWTISLPKNNKVIYQNLVFHPYNIRRGNTSGIHPFCIELESKTIRGEAVALKALELKQQGFIPDLIVGHPGWGEMLFLGDIWQGVPQIHYVEFFHAVPGTDNDFDGKLGPPLDWTDRAQGRIKNTHHLSGLNAMTAGITPTHFQHSVLPDWAQKLTTVIHDGIDTIWLSPNPSAAIEIPPRYDLPFGLKVQAGDPVVTFINRTYEPYRGVHIFLEALAQLQQQDPNVQALLVGQDSPKVSYGSNRKDGIGWLSTMKYELGNKLDWTRIHALGLISHLSLRKVYQVSAAHVYLSYPYVLSWSMLEAMSCGALVIGSATAPVQEVIEHGNTGFLVPFSDPTALAASLLTVLNQPNAFTSIRKRARLHIQRNYQLKDCIKKQISLIDKVSQRQ